MQEFRGQHKVIGQHDGLELPGAVEGGETGGGGAHLGIGNGHNCAELSVDGHIDGLGNGCALGDINVHTLQEIQTPQQHGFPADDAADTADTVIPKFGDGVLASTPIFQHIPEQRYQTTTGSTNEGGGIGEDLLRLPVPIELDAVELGGAQGEQVFVL